MCTGSENREHPQYLVIPFDKVSHVSAVAVAKTIEALGEKIQAMTDRLDKIVAEMVRTNSLEADKIRFSKMKDIMLAKISKMMEKDRQVTRPPEGANGVRTDKSKTEKGEADGTHNAGNA